MSVVYATRVLIEASLDHVMWCADPIEDMGVRCSCGWWYPDTMFEDDVVLSDIKRYSGHTSCLVAYPERTHAEGPYVLVVVDDVPHRVADSDLTWLLAQPGLPDGFRRAAAVHLPGDD